MIGKRILALDIGSKTIGIAVSDPFNEYAVPSDTYWRKGGLQADVNAILRIIREKDCGTVVCGLPVNYDGTPSQQTAYTQRFIDALSAAASGVTVVTEDERFTTQAATQDLIGCGVKGKDKKKTLDSIAATYILESYMSRNKNQGGTTMKKREYKEVPVSDDEYSDKIELVNEEGGTETFRHYGSVQFEKQWYCMLAPYTEDEEEEVSVGVYKIVGSENDERIVPLEDEALMEAVFAEFMHQQEYMEDEDALEGQDDFDLMDLEEIDGGEEDEEE